jgi:hypothetical protein
MAATGELKERIQLLQAAVARGQATGKTLRPEIQAELDSYASQGLLGASSSGGAGKPATREGEDKANAFLIRALGANRGYENTGLGARSLVGQALADSTPNALNVLPGFVGNSDARQVADTTQDEFVAATLRQDSGAAIPDDELQRQKRIYFPQPGDSEAALNAKRQARLRAIQGLVASAGRAVSPDLMAEYPEYFPQSKGGDQTSAAGGAAAAATGNDAPPSGPIGPGDIGFAGAEASGAPLNPQQQAAYDAFWAANPDATAEDLRSFGKSLGFDIGNADAIIEARKAGAGVQPGSAAVRGDIDISADRGNSAIGDDLKAFARGVPGAVGLDDELLAAADVVLNGKDWSEALDYNRAIRHYDEENNFWSRLAGSVVAGAALPSGVIGAGRSAAIAAARSGVGREAALLAGARGAAVQGAQEGAALGGAYGFGATDGGFGDRLSGAAINALVGGASGAALAGVGQRLVTRGGRSKGYKPSARALAQQEGVDLGIDLPLAATGGRGSAILDNTLSNLPGAATVMDESRQRLTGQVQGAVRRVAQNYGSGTTLVSAGEAAQRGARSWIDKFERVSGNLYNSISIPDNVKAVTSNTTKKLNSLLNRFSSNEDLQAIFKNGEIEAYRNALSNLPKKQAENELKKAISSFKPHLSAGGGDVSAARERLRNAEYLLTKAKDGSINWRDLKDFRSVIGEKIGEFRFGESASRNDLRSLYAALSEDMRETAASQGSSALARFERANRIYAEGQQRIENVLTDLIGRDGKLSAEKAGAFIDRISQSNKSSSDIEKLRDVRKSIPLRDWNEVASSLISVIGQPSNSEGRSFSVDTFTRRFADMAPEAKALLFSGAGRDTLRVDLDKFARVSGGLARVNALRNTSNTAGQVLTGLTFYSLGNLPALIGQAAASYGAAKLMTNPAFVRWATGYQKMLKASVAARRPPSEKAIEGQLSHLKRVGRSNPIVANEVLQMQDLIRRAFEQSPSRAAAAEEVQQ